MHRTFNNPDSPADIFALPAHIMMFAAVLVLNTACPCQPSTPAPPVSIGTYGSPGAWAIDRAVNRVDLTHQHTGANTPLVTSMLATLGAREPNCYKGPPKPSSRPRERPLTHDIAARRLPEIAPAAGMPPC